MNDAEKAWEIAKLDIPNAAWDRVAKAEGGEIANALRACFLRGFRDGQASARPEGSFVKADLSEEDLTELATMRPGPIEFVPHTPPFDPTNEMLEAAVEKCGHMVEERFRGSWNLYEFIWTTMYEASRVPQTRHSAPQHEEKP